MRIPDEQVAAIQARHVIYQAPWSPEPLCAECSFADDCTFHDVPYPCDAALLLAARQAAAPVLAAAVAWRNADVAYMAALGACALDNVPPGNTVITEYLRCREALKAAVQAWEQEA